MKKLLPALLLLLTLFGCNKSGPIHCYKIKDSNKFAIIIDSTLNFMCGSDTAYIYELKIMDQFVGDDRKKFKVYGLKYFTSVTRFGYGDINCPLKFEGNRTSGGLPIAIFVNDEYFDLGGYFFTKDTLRTTFLNLLDLEASADQFSH